MLFCSPYLYSSFPSYILLYPLIFISLPFHLYSLLLHVIYKQKLVSIVNPMKAAIHFLDSTLQLQLAVNLCCHKPLFHVTTSRSLNLTFLLTSGSEQRNAI